jgi:dethiobiotin synthetase/adenosylmethionine--8-amino-7-oxononanoate aminotransferase
MARAVGAAAARYGHVIFPQAVHAPALALAQALLAGPGGGWAARVFYTDNGSTAVEAALKMAFRLYMTRTGSLDEARAGPALEVMGLQEAYHGDTLGAMDAVAPSPFNGRLQTPWYSGRGLFLDPPTAAVAADGRWRLRLPPALTAALAQDGAAAAAAAAEAGEGFADAGALFARPRGGGALAAAYRAHVEAAMEAHAAGGRAVVGACILEPVVQGAGGMRVIDPEFQRAVVAAARARAVPVVFDEVFTGLGRLGAPSGAALLEEAPDVACYAKLLTGGVVPLAATLATDEVFQAFKGALCFLFFFFVCGGFGRGGGDGGSGGGGLQRFLS